MTEVLGVPYPPRARANGLGEMVPRGDVRDRLNLQGTVERVNDGNTITVRAGPRRLRVYLLGTDAPELHYRGQSQHPWGELARRRLQALAPAGTRVRMITDRQLFEQYGRLLAHVYRGRRNLNLEMVRSGWAVAYQIYPNVSLLGQMEQATVAAQATGRGIFDPRRPLPLLPYEFRQQMDHRPPAKFCGDTRTRRYVPPAEYQRVDVAHRVFFFTEADARAFGHAPAEPGISTLAEAGEEGAAEFTPAMMARLRLRGLREAAHPLFR